MTQEEAKAYADGLRELADWYEKHPEMPGHGVYVHLDDYPRGQARANLALAAKAMGNCEKSFSSYSVAVTRKFGAVTLTASVDRDAICKKIVTYDCPESLLKELGEDFVDALAAS